LQGEKDDKIIAVCADDPEFRHYTSLKELPPHRLAEIRRFFEDCILNMDSVLYCIGWGDLPLDLIITPTILGWYYATSFHQAQRFNRSDQGHNSQLSWTVVQAHE